MRLIRRKPNSQKLPGANKRGFPGGKVLQARLSKAKSRLKLLAEDVSKSTIQKFPIPKISFRSLVPGIAGLIAISLLVHSGMFLVKAKQASGIVLGEATSAYQYLDAANQSLSNQDFGAAKDKFNSAQTSLLNAQGQLEKFRALTLVASSANSADKVLTGAYFLAEAGKNLTYALQLFDDLSVNSEGIETDDFITKLGENKELLGNSLTMIHYAEQNFEQATDLPSEYQATLEHAKSQIISLKTVLTDLVSLEDLFLSYFGHQPKTYLLAFQNYDEMRATGGFIGTIGVLKYENGAIQKLKIESVYNLDGSLTKQIAAPGPFQPAIAKWGLRDANWFADFPTSAKKMLEFFEYGSETADGVIALTPHIFGEILKLVGPIEMPEYGVTLTSDNFQEVVQLETSVNYDKTLNQPKKFLDDFAPVMLDRLSGLKKEEWFMVFQIIKDSFLKKHALVYSTEAATQGKITRLGFDGGILDAEHDYLSINNSNLGGTKTDLDIQQHVNYQSRITSEGLVINTVTVRRVNQSLEDNLSFLRILVPLGSNLIDSAGFDDKEQVPSEVSGFAYDPELKAWDQGLKAGNAMVRQESGKTEFTGWTKSVAQGESQVTVRYILPNRIETGMFNRTASHSLVLQKQLGSLSTNFSGEWILDGYGLVWSSWNQEGAKAMFTGDGETDNYWGIVISK
jgi:hypothetical protein